MEALDFMKEAQRMCGTKHCVECPIGKYINHSEDKLEEIVSAVEQWSEEHPVMTNAQKFNEVFGFMPAGCQTFYFIEPKGPYSKTINWQDPYKEPEHE